MPFDSDASQDALREALRNFKATHGHAAVDELLERVAGVSRISQVPKNKIQMVIEATNGAAKASPKLKSMSDIDPTAVYRKWNEAYVRPEGKS